MSGLVRNYADARPPARIRLDLTTNPLGSPEAARGVLLDAGELARYPDSAELAELKDAIAALHGILPEEIMLTAGADQGIEIALLHVLAPGGTLGIVVPTFPRFEIVARQLCRAEVVRVGAPEDLPECEAICLCTPNNPTTEEIPADVLAAIVEARPGTFFVVDAAFSAFGSQSLAGLLRFPNVAVLRSLSKSHGLAGLRVGWIESQAKNIDRFREGVSPFRLSPHAQRVALAALGDDGHVQSTRRFLSEEFARIRAALGSRVVRESDVPFYLFLTEDPDAAREELLRHGIATVSSTSFPGAREGFLRIMIGPEADNAEAIAALARVASLDGAATPVDPLASAPSPF